MAGLKGAGLRAGLALALLLAAVTPTLGADPAPAAPERPPTCAERFPE